MSGLQHLSFNSLYKWKHMFAELWKQGDEEDSWRDKAIEVLIKKLKKEPNDQYKALREALNERHPYTPCVTLSKSQDGRIQVCHRKMYPHLISCRIFRWADLQQQAELKPACPTANKGDKVCVNPYHYERLVRNPSIFPPVVTPRNLSSSSSNQPPTSNASPMPPGSPESYFSTSSSLLPSTSMVHHQSPPPPSLNYQENQMDSAYYTSIQQQQHHQQHQQQNHHHQHQQQHHHHQQQQQQPLALQYQANNQQQQAMPYYHNSQQSSPLSESNWHYGTNGYIHQAGSPPDFESQSPPPGYQQQQQQQQQMYMDTVEDHTIAEGTDSQWCVITYAELTQKVGEPFRASSSKIIVDGFTNPSIRNHRFSLGVLSNINRNASIEETRRAIRKGICLENYDNQVHVLNMSESSIFFHSKNCNVENDLDPQAVVKIGPQVRKKLFDQSVLEDLIQNIIRQNDDGLTYQRLYSLIEHCIIKMSFVKGWGSIYQRQEVTATPCWIEIQLLRPMALIDQYLREIRNFPKIQVTSTS